MNKYIVIIIATVIVEFAVSKTIIVTAQSNSTNSDRRNIIVTWLEANKTKTGSALMISISGEDFWKIFEPLLKQSIKGSADLPRVSQDRN